MPRRAGGGGRSSKSTRDAGSRAEELLDEEGEAPRSRPFWSGTISFGLVTIPVDLYAATRTTRASLRMLSPSGTPVARRYFDEAGTPVDRDQLARGYELDDGKYVIVTDEELDSLAPDQSRDIDLSRFVSRDEIPPLHFDRAYLLTPAGNSNLAYRLLASTLEQTRRAGIATFVMRGKQHVVAIVADKGLLRAETLRFADEIRTPEEIGLPPPAEVTASAVSAFRRAIDKATGSSVPEKELADSYWQRLEKLVEQKQKRGEDIVKPVEGSAPEENLAEVIDLVAVLRRSLGQVGEDKEQSPSPARQGKPRQEKPRSAKPRTRDAPPATPRATPRKAVKKRAPAKKAPAKRAAHGR